MPPSIEFIAMPPDPAPNRTGRHATGRWFTSARLAGSLETLGPNPLGAGIRATGDTFSSDAKVSQNHSSVGVASSDAGRLAMIWPPFIDEMTQ